MTQLLHWDEPRGDELREFSVEKRCKQIRPACFVERRFWNLEVRGIASFVGAALARCDRATLESYRDRIAGLLVEEENIEAVVICNRPNGEWRPSLAFMTALTRRFSPMTPTRPRRRRSLRSSPA